MTTFMFWAYITVAIVIACASVGIGLVATHKERSSYTGRYTSKDARMILVMLTLGPLLIAPLWLPSLLVGGLGWYCWTIRRVGQDAHLDELVPEWMEKRAVWLKYKALQEQNARLEKELEARSRD